jgi:large subunit ribosomal protein L16
MLLPKKVKFRKWQTGRKNPVKLLSAKESRGTTLAFGAFGLKAIQAGRIKSNQLEAARKAMSRAAGKNAKIWIRVFPDRPFTAKPAEVGMGAGKGDPQGYVASVLPGRVIFEIDGVSRDDAFESLRKAGTKLPVRTKFVARQF